MHFWSVKIENSQNETCRLCHQPASIFYSNEFFSCENCESIFRGSQFLPNPEKEKSRYDLHENNPLDPGYLQFVSPITNYVLKIYSCNEKGLDFGSGPNSSISNSLKEKNYSVTSYDPFYCNDQSVLNEAYDYIICCEVIEHFHQPDEEFWKLKKLLRSGGELLLMTDLWNSEKDFSKWYYKNDFTHVHFFSPETIHWIRNEYGFSNVSIEGRFIRLKN